MKKWFVLLAVIVILVLVGFKMVQHQVEGTKNADVKEEVPSHEKAPISDSTDAAGGQYIEVAQDQVHLGNLLLVNKDYPLHPEAVKSDVVNLFDHKELVQGYDLLDAQIQLSEDLAHQFMNMVESAQKDGVDHFLISSGYRSVDKQKELYKEKGSKYALPAGASEHNLGLSLDIGSSLTEMNKAPEGKWLKENAWKDGFILRYPEDKVNITGIEYEPWHFRYVGLPHSAIMYEKNMTLEEYLDYLKEQKHISEQVEGKTYEISYYPDTDISKIPLPKDSHYEISGNNKDGVIVTTS